MLLPVVIIGAAMMIFSTVFVNSMDGSVEQKKNEKKEQSTVKEADEERTDIISALKMRIGDEEFTVDVDFGAAGQEFARATPFELEMTDLNKNEKYYQGADKFENVDAKNVNMIEIGDVMLYGDDTIVIFYDNFKTEYQYTRLGWIEEKAKLVEALGDGDVAVSFTKN